MFSTDPSAIVALWSRARAMFARALVIIGSAQALASIASLTRERRHEIVGWLGLAESIVRKLLLAEASRLERDLEQRPAPLVAQIVSADERSKAACPIDTDQPST